MEYVWKYGGKLMLFTLNMNLESEVFYWVLKFFIRYKEFSEYCVEVLDDLKNEILFIEESEVEDLSVYNVLKFKVFS